MNRSVNGRTKAVVYTYAEGGATIFVTACRATAVIDGIAAVGITQAQLVCTHELVGATL